MEKRRLTHLGKSVVSAGDKSQYDTTVKEILANKQILAWILKWTTNEFSDMEIEGIVGYIENPYVSEIPVFPGLTNEAIDGMSTESKINNEETATYDVRFYVKNPRSDGKRALRIIVDLEAQKAPNPGYDIVTRGIFYCGRMLSDQEGRNFDGKNYDKLEKVYSIWIVFNCPEKNANTTSVYQLAHKMIHGDADLDNRYDMLQVVEVRLPSEENADKCKNEATKFHSMLYDLFVRKEDKDKKLERLRRDYGLKTVDLERRINDMCNLSDVVWEKGMEKGMEKGIEKGIEFAIQSLIKSGMSKEEVIERLQISEETYEKAESNLYAPV